MARYLLIVTFEPGVVDSPMEEWQPEEITAHLDYYRALNDQLVESGELVDATILTPPDAAHIVRADASGGRVVTDGPFQEFKEWVAGFQVVDVETEERALEIAALVSAVPGPGGVPLQQPIHVRRVMDDGPSDVDSDGRVAGGCGRRALSADRTTEDLLRELAPQVVGVLTRRSGDFAAAEDAVQEALVAAHTTWPRDGIPDHPRAWLVTAATRRLVDEQRSAAARRRREQDWAAAQPAGAEAWPAGRHPHRPAHVLPPGAVAGLGGGAHPARRGRPDDGRDRRGLPRARTDHGATHLARQATPCARRGQPFALPASHELGDRVRRALAVVYLLYNEGYAASTGTDLTRTDRSAEAIRLGRLVHRLLPDDPEATALLALMLLLDARRPARVTASGDLVTLAEQDRQPLGPLPRRRGHRAARLDDRRRSRARRVPAAGRDRRGARPGARRRPTPTGRRSSPSTACSSRWRRAPSSRWRARSPSPRPRARTPRRRVLDGLEPGGRPPAVHAVQRPRRRAARRPARARRHYLAAAARATNLAEQRHLTRRAAELAQPPPHVTPSRAGPAGDARLDP